MANQKIKDYRHDSKRKNNPPAGMVSYEKKIKEPEVKRYAYDPHLSPQLVWAGKPGLTTIEVEDKAGVEAETVSLHVHERVSTQAILNTVQNKPKQTDLFADPELPLQEAVKFYQHDVDWANRLILGDSLLVANSLIERELMAGKMQMIYMDPPYGVKFSSNFQPRIDQREVKDGDEHLTREPEMIKAYRDTWKLGIHSYLTYMRDRLRLFKDLLTDSGSIFVQISDENVHHIREMLDDLFGVDNFISEIIFTKTRSLVSSDFLTTITDYILWYAKNREQAKYKMNKLFEIRKSDELASHYEDENGGIYSKYEARRIVKQYPNKKLRPFMSDNLIRSSNPVSEVKFEGQIFRGGYRTNPDGMSRLIEYNRIFATSNQLRYKFFLDDFPASPLNQLWSDTIGATDKIYVVQTNSKIIERCILMTTDPGDLVFDLTCGSGTSAYVAEQWGRRWITCDTSRVALALARQRLLTATFPYYKDTWKKLERALKGKLDEDRFDLLTGQVSLPFKSGKYNKAAVKVIDQRGNEVMKVVRLDGKYEI